MEEIYCPNCGTENPLIQYIDEEGTHYQCQNCFHEWCMPGKVDDKANGNSDKVNNVQ